jgi:hypothetical protein|tara:strand:- start:2117 stop:2284 length:168 start_codon:yes stop_codon:yes gene_type:complete
MNNEWINKQKRACELCGSKTDNGMRYAKHVACFRCIDKVVEFAITAGMRFEDDSV